jgi:Protein tyrosine and serine/threonine kinase
MTTTQDTLDLESLAGTYEIIGELGGRNDARTFIAKQRDTRMDVLIAVMGGPEGDEGNALSHLAADANRLAELHHRNLVPILEGKWVGPDAFALITERVYYPSLAELLLRRDEAFSCPRVATVLQEINGVLEWARNQKVVHRAIGLETVFLEPGSDRVLVNFAVRALPLADMPGPEEDAKTIATLARAMLTRSVADPERDRLPLAEVRPGLPERLIGQTEELLGLTRSSAVPDVTEYIAVIAMADALKKGETECAETTRKLLEEERVAREMIEGQRQATERAAAEQARLFQDERDQFAREREKIQRALDRERETLARERAALARERDEHQKDRATLLAEREDHKQWAEKVERAFTEQAEAFERQQAALAASASHMTLHTSGEHSLVMPPRPNPRQIKPEWARSLSRLWDRRPPWNRRWNMPLTAAALLLIIAVTAVAFGRSRTSAGDQLASTAAVPAPMVDSVSGAIEPSPSAAAPANVPGIPADFIASVAGGAPAGDGRVGAEPARQSGVPADFIAGVAARAASGPDAPQVIQPPFRRPNVVVPPPTPGPQPLRASDTLSPARTTGALPFVPRLRDSAVRRDTTVVLPRRDSVRPDIIPVDTLPS